MNDFMIETENLTKFYGQKCALNNLTIKIPAKSISAIVGANGAGKSTLFRILLGTLKASYGKATLLGHDINQLTPNLRGRVGFVNEEHSLPGWLTIKQLAKMQRSDYVNWQDEVYRQVIGRFDVIEDQKISCLSRGERAGVNLAMALAQKPEILLLDEPTLGLDIVAKQAFLDSLISTQQESQSSVIYCSHAMEEIEQVADQLIVMERGKLRSQSTPSEFIDRVRCWRVSFNGNAPLNSTIAGLLQRKKVGDYYQYTILDQGDAFISNIESLGATFVDKISVNLNYSLTSFLSKNHAKAN